MESVFHYIGYFFKIIKDTFLNLLEACGGAGIATCDQCGGAGGYTCLNCNGTGEMTPGDNCILCHGGKSCTTCGGTRKVSQ